jgi:FkbM family methyltransferase
MKRLLKRLYDILPFKKQVFLVLRLLPLPHSIYSHLHFRGVITMMVNHRQVKMIHYGYELENDIFWKGLRGWEKSTMDVWIALSRNADCIIDIGSNTGLFALVAKACRSSATVVAFEPVKRIAQKLEINVRLNDFDVIVEACAVSESDGKAIIYDTADEHMYSVTVNRNLNLPDQKVLPIEIDVVRLSSYVKLHDLKEIGLVKIDVETHEPEVLNGMLDIIDKYLPALVIEILNEEVAERVNEILVQFNYLFFVLDDKKGPLRVAEIKKREFKNYLVCSAADAGYLSREGVITNSGN